jgi:hypothetical protein
MPNPFAASLPTTLRVTFGDCGGTVNGIVQREGPELYKYQYAGRWNDPARRKTRYNSVNRARYITDVKDRILDEIPTCYTFYHFVYENLHEFIFEKNAAGQIVMIQGWVGHFTSWEWFFPEAFGVGHRESTAMYASVGPSPAKVHMKQRKLLYGEGQDLAANRQYGQDKVSQLLDALGEMLAHDTYAAIPAPVWKKLPFPPAVADAITRMAFLTYTPSVGAPLASRPVNLDVQCFPVRDNTLATLNARIVDLRNAGADPRFISDVVLYDSYNRVMDTL